MGMVMPGIAKNFYQSAKWKAIRVKALERDGYKCVHCGISIAGFKKSRVDHIIEVKARPDLALTLSNLRSLCATCDNRRHSMKLGRETKVVLGSDDQGYAVGWE